MDARSRGGSGPGRARFAAVALAAGLCAVATEARGDLVFTPPPCTGGHAGDACDGAGAEPGVCQSVRCDDSSRFWRVAKGADGCLACVVPPDPAVGTGAGGAATSGSMSTASPRATEPPVPEGPPGGKPALSFVVRAGVIFVAALGLLRAFVLARRNRRSPGPRGPGKKGKP